MKALFDTSILVAGLIEQHKFRDLAFPWLRSAWDGDIGFFIGAHSLAETFATLTTYPIHPRISPASAKLILSQTIAPKATVIPLETRDYLAVIERQASLGLVGGSIYDALLARAAQKAEVDLLLTFNPKDFLRVWPEGAEKVRVP